MKVEILRTRSHIPKEASIRITYNIPLCETNKIYFTKYVEIVIQPTIILFEDERFFFQVSKLKKKFLPIR